YLFGRLLPELACRDQRPPKPGQCNGGGFSQRVVNGSHDPKMYYGRAGLANAVCKISSKSDENWSG
ncbi:MAG: hypothetical protein RLZZ182_308, partial [Pseudomonadota bacterium]